MECIFCQIAKKKLKSDIAYENKDVIAVYDVNPKAPIHIVFFPKKHSADSVDSPESDKKLSEIFTAIRKVASDKKVHDSGYRIVTNHGQNAGQTIKHLHFHLLGGNQLNDL